MTDLTTDEKTIELAQEVYNRAFELGYAERVQSKANAEYVAARDRVNDLRIKLHEADEALVNHLRALADKARGEKDHAADKG